MSSPPIQPAPLPESLIQAAIAWAVRIHYSQPTAKDWQALDQWLQADALHAVAWQRVNGFKGFEAELGDVPAPLARDALQAVQQLRKNQGQKRSVNRRTALKLMSWGGVALTSGWLAREHTPWQRVLADASTRVGEQKTLQLEDGSTLVLNTDSAVRIAMHGSARSITLLRGEILVSTGADHQAEEEEGRKRPFWVHTPVGRMQALGTRFTVRMEDAQPQGERARIAVQEGAVALYPAHAQEGDPAAIVAAGESRWLTANRSEIAKAQNFQADDWAQGVIAGQNMRLQDLLAEIERYRHGRIVCEPSVANVRVSGLFHIQDTDRALQFLAQTQPIQLHYRTRWWVTVSPRNGG